MFYASWSKDSASLRIDSFNKRLLFLYSIVKPCRADLGFLSNGEVADFQKFFANVVDESDFVDFFVDRPK